MDNISVFLQGGLANNMFQIACSYSYGKKHNKNLILLNQKRGIVHNSLDSYRDNIFRHINFYENYNSIKFNNFIEPSFSYTEIPFISGNIILDGYFQSEKHFIEYSDEIKKLFISEELLCALKEKYKNILENNITCSIHVRRGDYVSLSHIHPPQNMNYYMKAIKSMPKETLFLVFSDDISWCKENFPDIPEKFIFIEGGQDYEDLYLMSLCDNNIIANSSFSWWGAWLNRNENKKVIAPSVWFGNNLNNTKDLYCSDWTII